MVRNVGDCQRHHDTCHPDWDTLSEQEVEYKRRSSLAELYLNAARAAPLPAYTPDILSEINIRLAYYLARNLRPVKHGRGFTEIIGIILLPFSKHDVDALKAGIVRSDKSFKNRIFVCANEVFRLYSEVGGGTAAGGESMRKVRWSMCFDGATVLSKFTYLSAFFQIEVGVGQFMRCFGGMQRMWATTTAVDTEEVLLGMAQRLGLDINYMVGATGDTCHTNFGVHAGVIALLKKRRKPVFTVPFFVETKCVIHLVQLAADFIPFEWRIEELKGIASATCQSPKTSALYYEMLPEHASKKRISMYCPTRWNSRYYFISGIMEHRRHLVSFWNGKKGEPNGIRLLCDNRVLFEIAILTDIAFVANIHVKRLEKRDNNVITSMMEILRYKSLVVSLLQDLDTRSFQHFPHVRDLVAELGAEAVKRGDWIPVEAAVMQLKLYQGDYNERVESWTNVNAVILYFCRPYDADCTTEIRRLQLCGMASDLIASEMERLSEDRRIEIACIRDNGGDYTQFFGMVTSADYPVIVEVFSMLRTVFPTSIDSECSFSALKLTLVPCRNRTICDLVEALFACRYCTMEVDFTKLARILSSKVVYSANPCVNKKRSFERAIGAEMNKREKMALHASRLAMKQVRGSGYQV